MDSGHAETRDTTWRVVNGDCREVMRTLPDASVDAVVSDPPYGLAFMGKGWDHAVPGVEFWAEALRVAKPGAHLVAFGGTRTFHRLAVAIEDAGWEVRDCLSWLYGSGFPKSLAVDKAIDKMDAAEEQAARRYRFTAWVRSTGATARQIDEATGTNMGGHYTTSASQPAIMTREHLEACRPLLGDIPEWVERECDIRSVESRNFAEREVVGTRQGVDTRRQSIACATAAQGLDASTRHTFNITAPATPLAQQWQGWGTALKPAYEPVILARKPLAGTVAANVAQHGTGALNVDGCRIGTEQTVTRHTRSDGDNRGHWAGNTSTGKVTVNTGRWPANVVLDEDAAAMLGEPSRFFYTAKASRREREAGLEGGVEKLRRCNSGAADGAIGGNRRAVNVHPTVKPIALMRWLCRLVTPPGGLVLDPFTGSGTTGCAAVLEGFRFVGAELDPEYVEIAQRRIAHWAAKTNETEQPSLF